MLPVQRNSMFLRGAKAAHRSSDRNKPIARVELHQLSYIPTNPSGVCMKESNAS
jgi:hypothetical protein